MDAAAALLPSVHKVARAADAAAGRRSGWFSSTFGSSSRGNVTIVAQLSSVRADVASAGAEVLGALLGLFRLSVSGCVVLHDCAQSHGSHARTRTELVHVHPHTHTHTHLPHARERA